MLQYRFKPRRKRRVYDKTEWLALTPSKGILISDTAEANALEKFGRKRGWRMARERQDDGTFIVGRVA